MKEHNGNKKMSEQYRAETQQLLGSVDDAGNRKSILNKYQTDENSL